MFKKVSLKICEKADFFSAMDSGFIPDNPIHFHLKYIQDVFLLSYLYSRLETFHSRQNVTIGEIGASHSRVLPMLKKYSENLFAIDVYDRSIGGGSTKKPETDEYQLIECLVGKSRGLIKDDYFDILCSVSVVENIPPEILVDFILDHYRIMKPGGYAVHLVDFYCNDDGAWERGITPQLFDALKHIDSGFKADIEDWSFKTKYCTNDDLTMYKWNQSFPAIATTRESYQCCSFVFELYK